MDISVVNIGLWSSAVCSKTLIECSLEEKEIENLSKQIFVLLQKWHREVANCYIRCIALGCYTCVFFFNDTNDMHTTWKMVNKISKFFSKHFLNTIYHSISFYQFFLSYTMEFLAVSSPLCTFQGQGRFAAYNINT